MKILGYYFSILLSVLGFICPIIGVYALYQEYDYAITLIVVLFTIAFVTFHPLHQLRNYFREQVEYDEFGRNKKMGQYKNLSRAQREAIDLQKTADMERILNTSMIKKMTKKGSVDPLKDMNQLIGLKPVKEKIEEMAARMEFDMKYQKKNKNNNSMSGRHMVFYGNPGTGKTTIARILTGFLYEYGYIKKNKCIEVDGNMLKAGKDTAAKTSLIIKEAYDGVLFIDEAYALMDSFDGQEAIATLIKEMEDNRDRFILIMAGYTKEMKYLLQSNPGFESRIKEYINFPDYTEDEFNDIFKFMAKEKGFTIDDDAYVPFQVRMGVEKTLSSFGNARTVRNLLDEMLDKHALNYQRQIYDKKYKFVIRPEDIDTKLKIQYVNL